MRTNVAVALRYIDAWLGGTGAVAIFDLMEDAATAEIARCQIWQWIRHGTPLADGGRVTPELVESILKEERVALGRGPAAPPARSGRPGGGHLRAHRAGRGPARVLHHRRVRRAPGHRRLTRRSWTYLRDLPEMEGEKSKIGAGEGPAVSARCRRR